MLVGSLCLSIIKKKKVSNKGISLLQTKVYEVFCIIVDSLFSQPLGCIELLIYYYVILTGVGKRLKHYCVFFINDNQNWHSIIISWR